MTYFFHLLHSLINMGKEMSTLHTLIFTHWFLHFHLPITHTSTKLLILAPSIIKWIHIYPKSLFIEKFFIPFHFSSFKTSCSGSKLLVCICKGKSEAESSCIPTIQEYVQQHPLENKSSTWNLLNANHNLPSLIFTTTKTQGFASKHSCCNF